MPVRCRFLHSRKPEVSLDTIRAVRAFFDQFTTWVNQAGRAPTSRFATTTLEWRIDEVSDHDQHGPHILPFELHSDLYVWVRVEIEERVSCIRVRLMHMARRKNAAHWYEALAAFIEGREPGVTRRDAVPPPPPAEWSPKRAQFAVPRMAPPRLPKMSSKAGTDPWLATTLYTHFQGSAFSEDDLGVDIVRAAGTSSRVTLLDRLRAPGFDRYLSEHPDDSAGKPTSNFRWTPAFREKMTEPPRS